MICFVDYKTTDEECNNLNKLGLKIIKIPQSKALYNAIDGHVDIQINILHKENRLILINKHMPDEFKKQLEENNIKYIRVILSDSQQPTTPVCLLINHHGCCEAIKNP